MLSHCETADELCKSAAFVLTTRDGTRAGLGLICFDCRYACVRWSGTDHIERRVATPADWSTIKRELTAGLPKAVLSPFMACARVLAGGADANVQWVGWGKRLDVDDPTKTPAVLDALLAEAGDMI